MSNAPYTTYVQSSQHSEAAITPASSSKENPLLTFLVLFPQSLSVGSIGVEEAIHPRLLAGGELLVACTEGAIVSNTYSQH